MDIERSNRDSLGIIVRLIVFEENKRRQGFIEITRSILNHIRNSSRRNGTRWMSDNDGLSATSLIRWWV